MRILLTIMLVLCCAATRLRSPKDASQSAGTLMRRSALVAPKPSIKLTWDFPASLESPDMIFKVYHSTLLSTPLALWTITTNATRSARSIVIPIRFNREFFTLTASNYLGESAPATK